MSIKTWIVKRVAFRRLWKLYRTNEDCKTMMEWLQGKKTIAMSALGALAAVLTAFDMGMAGDHVTEIGQAVASGDPKTMIMAAAAFAAFGFDRAGRKREHEERQAPIE